MSPDLAASVKARLLNRAREREEEFELVLVRFACERFLYRLGVSEWGARCVLKGAGLLSLWIQDPYRSTRDVDLLCSGANDEGAIREAMKTICSVPCLEDGQRFDLSSLELAPIREAEKYSGQRAVLFVYLGKAKVRLQVDFGFGDAVVPAPEEAEFPTLIPRLPAPRLRAYPREVTIAEKFQAMVDLGRRNSRMKDFHDIWALSEAFGFSGEVLRKAIAHCFERRGMAFTEEAPTVLAPGFFSAESLVARWSAYRRSGSFRTLPPADFEVIGEQIRSFLGPVRDSLVSRAPFDAEWLAGGPWRG